MANTADNQEGRDDAAAAPSAAVSEGVMKQLYDASGGANAERVDIDKAVALRILDKTKAALLLGSEIEGDFKRAYDAEKASRKPTFEAFKAAFTAVYGKLRFEKPAVSEQPNGKKQSPLVDVMARVLKDNKGLTGEGASFEGRPELRVMACAMDDMMLERKKAVSDVPLLRQKMRDLSFEKGGVSRRGKVLKSVKPEIDQLTESLVDGALLNKILIAFNRDGAKEEAAKRQAELDGFRGDLAVAREELKNYFRQINDFKSVLSQLIANAKARGDDNGVKLLESTLNTAKDFALDPEIGKFDLKGINGWQAFLNDELKELIDYLDKSEIGGESFGLAGGSVDSNLEQGKLFFSHLKKMAENLNARRDVIQDFGDIKFTFSAHEDNLASAKSIVDERTSELLKIMDVRDVAKKLTSPEMRSESPEIVGIAEEYLEAVEAFAQKHLATKARMELSEVIAFVETKLLPFLEALKSQYQTLTTDTAAKKSSLHSEILTLGQNFKHSKRLAAQEDPQKRVLEAVFHGMKIDDSGEISVHGFKGSTSRVMEKFDGKKDGAGNVVEVGALPWLEDSKNLGGVEKDMAELGGLVGTMESDQFVLLLRNNGIEVQGNSGNLQFPSVSKMRGKLEESVTALRGNMISDPNDRVIAAGVEKARARFEAEKERKVAAARVEWRAIESLTFNRREVRRRIEEDQDMKWHIDAATDAQNDAAIDAGTAAEEMNFKAERAEKERAFRDAKAETFDEGAAAEAIVGPAQKRRSLQAEKLGELAEALRILKKIEELTAKLEPKCKELVAHLGVGNTADVFGKAGLKFKKADGTEATFAEVEEAAKAIDAGKPDTFLEFHKMFGGYSDSEKSGFLADENKVEALVGEYKRVRASILEMTSKESPETAKRVVEEMLAQQGVPPEQINDVATAIIRDGVGIIATKKKWEQIAKECQPKVLENLQALAFRDKLSKFKIKKGEKASTPFAGLKPENFADQAKTEKTLRNLERTKGADWLLEYGFIIMAAFKVFEGNSRVEASGQGVVIEKYLKNMLAEKWLDKHPQFDSVDKAMMDSDFVQLINEEFEKRLERGAARFGKFSDAYDASAQGMKMKLALKLDRDIKVLKAKRKAKTIGKKEYDQQFTALLEQAEEEGVRGMLKEVSPRWKVSQAAFMSGLWNNDFMLGVRGVRENVADWLKAKSKALGATTVGGVVKGGFEFTKRMGIGAIVGGVMAPIGVVRWTGSFLKNLVLGRWTFGSTRALIGSDIGVAGKYMSGGVTKALADTAAHVKGMWEKVRDTKADDDKARRKEKGEKKLKLAESDSEALKGKTELDAVEVPAEPDKDIVSFFEKKHAALAERKKPASMRQERPRGEQERLAA